ncbi:MAG: Hsp20/alpha crystallin family protein [FCB group bacterium]|jgi:HSP20 family molecular chaperone IbpA|nr:Hsp20/alpha crystallin family protein [FCB group bacterium]
MKESTIPTKAEAPEAPATREESRALVPAVDIFEIEDGLAVIVDLPGVDKDHVDVNVDNNLLTIKGVVDKTEQGEPLYREYKLLDFFRQFELSDRIDREKIRAELRNGVLTLHLPKAEHAKPKRIAVEVSG